MENREISGHRFSYLKCLRAVHKLFYTGLMRYVLIMAGFLLIAFPVKAQENTGGGLSYTTLGARKERTGGHMNYRVLQQKDDKYRPLEPMDSLMESKDANKKPPEDEAAADQVWKKYKALAAGQYKEPAKEIVEPKNQPTAKEAAPAPTGIASILQEYQKNKAQRSQMRVIHVNPPKDMETKKIETEKKK
jgi:hypothetical protein